MIRGICSLALLASLVVPVAVRADVPLPKVEEEDKNRFTVPIEMSVDDKLEQPELHVPQSMLKTWRQAIGAGNAKRQAMEVMPTLLAGLALTLSFALSGVWLARKHGLAHGKALALLITAVSLCGFLAMNVTADEALPRTVKKRHDGPTIKVVVVEKGDAIKLILPRSQMDKLAEK